MWINGLPLDGSLHLSVCEDISTIVGSSMQPVGIFNLIKLANVSTIYAVKTDQNVGKSTFPPDTHCILGQLALTVNVASEFGELLPWYSVAWHLQYLRLLPHV